MNTYPLQDKTVFATVGGYDIGKEVPPTVVELPYTSSHGEIQPRASWFTVELKGNEYTMTGHILYALFQEGGEIKPLFTQLLVTHFRTDVYYTGLEDWKDLAPGEEELIGEYEILVSPEEPPGSAALFRLDGYIDRQENEPGLVQPSDNGGSSTEGEEDGWKEMDD